MKLLLRFLTLLGLFVIMSSFGKEGKIIWNKNRPLSWNDFNIIPESSIEYGGSVNSGIYTNFQVRKDTLTIQVVSIFSTKESWVQSGFGTMDALEHEQGHFDITEIYARKLKQRLLKMNFDSDGIKTQATALYNEITKEENAFQDLYDKETEHHVRTDIQKEWNSILAKELQSLEAFSDPIVKVKIDKNILTL